MLRFKQFIQLLEAGLLLESKMDFVKKQFKDKINYDHDRYGDFNNSDDIIDHLATMDPTPNKMYITWLIKQYNKGDFKQEDVPSVKSALENFHRYKNKLDKKDIKDYDLGQIKQAVLPYIGTTSTKAETKKHLVDTKQKLIYDSPRLRVFHTLGKEANQEIYGGGAVRGGTGTDWCTAARGNDNRYDKYNTRGNLYQIHAIDDNGEEQLYQYHPVNKEFTNKHDITVNMKSFVEKYPEMKEVIPFKGTHDALPLNDKELRYIIRNGLYNRDTLNRISNPTSRQMILMGTGLMKKIQNGTYDKYDLEHAKQYNYLTQNHLTELTNGLMKKIQNGTYDRYDLEHARDNNYITHEHVEALKPAYLQKLITGDLGLDEYGIKKELGVVNDIHLKKIKENVDKELRKNNSIDKIQSIIKSLDDNNLLDKDHKSFLADNLNEHLNNNSHYNFFGDIAKKHGYITPETELILKNNDLAKAHKEGKYIGQAEINAIANHPNSFLAHYWLTLAHKGGKRIGQTAINDIANHPNSIEAHYCLAMAHKEGKDVGQAAINAIANNPGSTLAHEFLTKAHLNRRYIGQTAIDAIANQPNSTVAHKVLAEAHKEGIKIGQHVIDTIANNPNSTEAHKVLAEAHKEGKKIGQTAIDAIANNPESIGAHEVLAQAHQEGRKIGQTAINAIVNQPESLGVHNWLAKAHEDGKRIGKTAINAIANNPGSTWAHMYLASAHEEGKRIGKTAIDAIVNNPDSRYAHEILIKAHEEGRSIGEANYKKLKGKR